MSTAKLLASALESFVALLVLYVTHRLLSIGVLSTTELTPLLETQTLVVGLLSDVWVATLVAAIILGVSSLLTVAGLPQAGRIFRLGVLVLSAVMVGAHQAYVDFYRFQIIPFHMRYLLDWDFLTANGLSLLGLKPFVVFLSLFVALGTLIFGDFLRDLSTRRLAIATVCVFFVALVCHNRNIHWRVQWFVQDNLQVNVAERLYLQLKTSDLPDPLTPAEANLLATSLSSDAHVKGTTPTSEELLRLITKPVRDGAEVSQLGTTLKANFAAAEEAGRRPMILVVLLESLRPSETGYFSATGAPSLTPNLDQVASSGVVFSRAFSTGSVTRGAQEAAFCGYLGSRDSSLMRGQTAVRMDCLPELARRDAARRAEVFWLHGGEGRFDNQVAFWSNHGVPNILSLKDFPADAPKTGWGVADATFFSAAAKQLADTRASTDARYLLGMALSVTNHIPWSLPNDLPGFTPPEGLEHQSYATTAYSDAAFGAFLADLKRRDLWNDTLLIIASDHGNSVPPYNDLYGASPFKQHLLQSHVNLLLTGGLVDHALASQGMTNAQIAEPVSQTDIAALVGYVADMDGRFMGENLLRKTRYLPVLATLEQDVFDPRAMRAYPRHLAAQATSSQVPAAEAKTLLYFRAFLQYTYTWGSQRP